VSENRKSIRRQTSDYFLVYERNTRRLIGRILDISPDGLRVMLDEPVEKSCSIQCLIKLPLPIRNVCTIDVDLTEVWSRRNEHTGWFEAGFRIDAPSSKTTEVISEIIRHVITEQSSTVSCTKKSNKLSDYKSPIQWVKSK